MIVVWLFLRVYLQFVIMVFPDHTHLLFLYVLSLVEASFFQDYLQSIHNLLPL